MDDLEWIKELQKELWPEEQRKKGGGKTRHGWVQIAIEAKRELGKREWERVQKAIEENDLIVEMNGTNMFGGVGIWIYEHPAAPGIEKADLVLTITQEHVFGEREPSGGNCLQEAFDEFTGMSSKERNLEWLKRYGLNPPKSKMYYCY